MKTKEQFINYTKKLSTIEHGKDGPTSINLVSKMLDKLPLDWSDPNLKILEPCFGFGTFLYFTYLRLLKYHDETHILDNMLYGIEIEPFRYQLTKNKFKIKNLYLGDTLNPTNKIEEILNMEFDVILGNPPYQANLDNANKKAEKPWPKFIYECEKRLGKNGLLSFVTPTSWLSGSKNIIKGSVGVMDVFLKNNLKYIQTGYKFKGVSVDTHFWIMRKNNQYSNTNIFDSITNQSRTISLHNGFLPGDLGFERIGIIEKVFSANSFDWIPSTSMYTRYRKDSVENKTPTHKVKTYVRGGNDEELLFAYFKQECSPENNKIKKVIIPLSGAEKFRPFIDIEGIPYCVDSYLIPLDDTATYDSVYSIFYSKLFKYLIESYRTSGFIQYPIVKKLPKLDTTKVYTDNDIYKFLGLTKKEIDCIENYVR